jgi:hypothetical protein
MWQISLLPSDRSLSRCERYISLDDFYDIHGRKAIYTILFVCPRHHIWHHQHPINVPTAGAQAFLMDLRTRRTGHTSTRAQCGLVCANDYKYSRDQRFNVPSDQGDFELLMDIVGLIVRKRLSIWRRLHVSISIVHQWNVNMHLLERSQLFKRSITTFNRLRPPRELVGVFSARNQSIDQL